ncbi:MAG TPA: nucleotidyltransferase family protein, partial [Clostridia bacterium]|nr:nucleotidyltransferase family protein [Clostridia bacterium]
MTSCVGIIAEYNPFHNGHLYQLARAKELSGCAFAAVAMSGSFTQRGEPACTD